MFTFIKVTLPSTITHLYPYFAHASNLQEINYYCNIDIPKNFCPGLSLRVLNIFGNVTKINANAFYGCNKLMTVSFPQTLECICTDAFNRTAIKSIVLTHTKLTTIEPGAFANDQKQ